MTVRIICADVLNGLAQLEDESVNCVVTSPPYWGLRDAMAKAQLGFMQGSAEWASACNTAFVDAMREHHPEREV